MQNTLLDPTLLLTEEQAAWLAETRDRNHARFAGWFMEDDDEDDQDDDDAEDGADDDKDEDQDDEEVDWKAKFEAQQRINKSLERKGRKDLKRIKDLETGPSKKPANKDDDDKVDVDKVREEAKQAAEREVLAGRVEDKIEAKATAFADPEDAVAVLLRSNKIDDFLDENNAIDVDAIKEALDDLAKDKPHLLAQGKRFKGGADGGRRKGADSRPKTLADAVTQRYAESR